MTTQAEIKVSSKPETPPQDTTLQSSLTDITPRPDPVSSTFLLKSHPATDTQDGGTINVVKTQTDMDTQTTGSTNRGKAKPNTLSKEVVQGSTKKLHELSLTGNEPTSNPHSDILETMNQTWSTVSTISTTTHSVCTVQTDGQPTQAHLPASAIKECSTRDDTTLLENVLKPNIQPENTAPLAVPDAETASAEITFYNRSQVSEFSTSSTVISGSTTESGFVVSSMYHSSREEGVKEEKQEASLLLVTPAVSAAPLVTDSVKVFTTRQESVSLKSTAAQTNPTPSLTVITPTLQNGEILNNSTVVAEMSIISAGGIKSKEEMDDRLETVSPKTDTTPHRQHPGEREKESGRETDEHEMHLMVDEEVERDTEMEKGSNYDDTEESNQSSLDWISHSTTVQSETHGAKQRPGIRGQRVRHCQLIAVPVQRFSKYWFSLQRSPSGIKDRVLINS